MARGLDSYCFVFFLFAVVVGGFVLFFLSQCDNDTLLMYTCLQLPLLLRCSLVSINMKSG